MPTISAATPRLLMIDSSRTPKALMNVVLIRVRMAQKIRLLTAGSGDGALRAKPKMLDSTRGTVAATAVTVRTPAQK